MTTSQLASLLEHLQLGFGDSLKAGTGFTEMVAAFRELPDQSLKELVKSLRKANDAQPPKSRTGSKVVDVPTVIEAIRAIRNGAAAETDLPDLGRLTGPKLKEILRAFDQPQTGNKDALIARARQLCSPTDLVNGSQQTAPSLSVSEEADVKEGVRVYTELRDNRSLSISDVRAGFERLRVHSKPVIEEISRRLRYTPHGSRTEMLDRLLSNLEGIKVSQYKMDQILTGT